MGTYQRCDRCGTSNEGHREVEIRWLRVQVYLTSSMTETQYQAGYSHDLCRACRDALEEFLKPLAKGSPS